MPCIIEVKFSTWEKMAFVASLRQESPNNGILSNTLSHNLTQIPSRNCLLKSGDN